MNRKLLASVLTVVASLIVAPALSAAVPTAPDGPSSSMVGSYRLFLPVVTGAQGISVRLLADPIEVAPGDTIQIRSTLMGQALGHLDIDVTFVVAGPDGRGIFEHRLLAPTLDLRQGNEINQEVKLDSSAPEGTYAVGLQLHNSTSGLRLYDTGSASTFNVRKQNTPSPTSAPATTTPKPTRVSPTKVPTATPTATALPPSPTQAPPTSTATALPPTATATRTETPVAPTETPLPATQTATLTATTISPSPTVTMESTGTPTPSPTLIMAPTETPSPSATLTTAPTETPTAGPSSAYWGVAIEGVPWDMSRLATWENMAGKKVSIVHYWQFWNQGGVPQKFSTILMDTVRNRGSIPMVTWPSEKMGGGTTQPDFQLSDIINGAYDAYTREWANAAKTWGKPFFLRWGHEMNGNWFTWSETANGNSKGQYVQAWKHIHDIFTSVGATNASWVWCPNVAFPGSTWPTYSSLYPGDDYVDWACLDGYNWGTGVPGKGGWLAFKDLYSYSYNTMQAMAPSKPLMIGEFASSEVGGSKASWITDALSTQIPTTFPRIKAHVWYNTLYDTVDWRVESSQSSIEAYKAAIASPYYKTNTFGSLTTSPIPEPN